VYGIVKQSGGYVYVDSTPAIGTAFVILLPRVADEPEADARPAARDGALPAGTETVLLVEDEESVRAVAARLLRDQGYTVLEAGNGVDALGVSAHATGPVHLLVTDLVMPGLGGRALAERLAEPHPALRVLFMSGYSADAATPRGAVPAGAAFLQKPFTPDALVRQVRAVLDG
jgi:CheY-like chemotaxis protein